MNKIKDENNAIKKRVEDLIKQGYPNPWEKASFERIELNKLERYHFIALKVLKQRKKIGQIKPKTSVKLTLNNAWSWANKFVESALNSDLSIGGNMGESVLIESYCNIPLDKLETQILEIEKEIKRKKDKIRMARNEGAIDQKIRRELK